MLDPGVSQRRGPRTVARPRSKPRRGGSAPDTHIHVEPHRGLWTGVERTLLAALSTLVSLNLWTGGPLLAIWVGSRVQASAGLLSMSAVAATIGVLIVVTLVLYRLLLMLNARYNAVIGRRERRRQAPWLKPMSGERRVLEVKEPLTVVEKVAVVWAVVAFEALVIWFFFFARYALPQ